MPTVLVAVAAAVVLSLLVGGLLDVRRASVPYHRDVNRSYVAQASGVARRSDQTGAELRSLMASMTNLGRGRLQRSLRAVADASAQEAADAGAIAPPDPTVDGFAQVMEARARAVAQVRGAVGGLLGLGRTGRSDLQQAAAAGRITAAGTALQRADAAYARVRKGFLSAPGHARLPRSRWVTDANGWAAGPVQDLMQALTLTAGLAPRHRVVLRPGTLHIEPLTVPQLHPGQPSVVLPTHTVTVSVVVANDGNVAEHGVRVTASVAPQGPGRPDSTSLRVSVVPGGSVAVTFRPLSVAPNDSYTLTVSLQPPPGQTDTSGTSTSTVVHVAPPTPTTTTTTVPATTSTG